MWNGDKINRRAAGFLTVCRSVASFSMEGFKLSTAFRPSWKKLNRKHKNTSLQRSFKRSLHVQKNCLGNISTVNNYQKLYYNQVCFFGLNPRILSYLHCAWKYLMRFCSRSTPFLILISLTLRRYCKHGEYRLG